MVGYLLGCLWVACLHSALGGRISAQLPRNTDNARGPPEGFEAAWRAAAAKFAAKIQPAMSAFNQQELKQGLSTKDPRPPLVPVAFRQAGPSTHESVASRRTKVSFFVSPDRAACSDSGPGSEQVPFCTVKSGVHACRAAPSGGCALILREGTHRLVDTILLTPEDSNLTIAGYPGEHAVVSGTKLIDSGTWHKVEQVMHGDGDDAVTVWRAPVGDLLSVETLLVDGVRAIPARYPNADPETDKFPIGYISSSTKWLPPSQLGDPKYIEVNSSATFRPSYRSLFQDYRGGVGGQCSHYDPPFSYWCAEVPQGGGAAQFKVPSGLVVTPGMLPHAPYANLSGGRVTAWRPGHWANWQFEIAEAKGVRQARHCNTYNDTDATGGNDVMHKDNVASAAECVAMCNANCACDTGVWGKTLSGSHNCYLKSAKASVEAIGGHPGNVAFNCTPCPSPPTTTLHFARGGFQGGRGNAQGREWFVSHLREELDFPREYWYNSSDGMLYFVSGTATIDCRGDPNCNATRTQPAPAHSTFELATLKTLFELRGTQAAPVSGITFSSLTFTGSAETFLDPHGVPSGGDWALQRSAALFFEGTRNVTVEACDLIRLDGNAVMLSGYNQHANISHNTFLSTGATAIALWGYSNGTDPLQPEGTGPDGTQGNFPRWTTVQGNFIRHLGVHEKQSSCLFQAKSAQSYVSHNLCFDVPRAGFNLNDGFGGGHDIYNNLLFQTCGESGDHGAINVCVCMRVCV